MPETESSNPTETAAASCLFQQPYWLNTVAPGQWQSVEVRRDRDIVARWAFVSKKKWGLKVICHPPLTPILGPWLAPQSSKPVHALGVNKTRLNQLLEQLPRHDFLIQNLHPEIRQFLPFQWQGFETHPQCTYVMPDLKNLSTLWEGMHASTRQAIRKGERAVEVVEDLDVSVFIDANRRTFARQQKKLPYSASLLENIAELLEKRDQGRFLYAQDVRGRTHAALLMVWDQHSAYYLAGGSDPELRESNAFSFLMWKAIQLAASRTKSFDFEGSSLPSIERFFRYFGGHQQHYWHLKHYSRRFACLHHCRRAFGALAGRP